MFASTVLVRVAVSYTSSRPAFSNDDSAVSNSFVALRPVTGWYLQPSAAWTGSLNIAEGQTSAADRSTVSRGRPVGEAVGVEERSSEGEVAVALLTT